MTLLICHRANDLYVLDEAQKIKNPNTNNHKAVKRLSPRYRWALTGTPIENSVDDVVAIFSVLKPDLFGSRFVANATRWYNTDVVRREIAPYLLRRTIAETHLQLPKLTHQDHWLDLKPAQRRAYNSMEHQSIGTLRRLGVDATRVEIFAQIAKLKQICNYDVISGQSCKLEFLKEELTNLCIDKEKALVFSQYPNKTLREIEPQLRKFKPLMFDGSMTARKRDDAISRFQDSEENDVMLTSVKAGGVGITLTRANHVFHFDHWWNPATVDQASARAHRIGQKKPVFVHSLYAANTIEERIYNMLREKREIFQQVFGKETHTDDKVLERLSDQDLYGLFGMDAPIGVKKNGRRPERQRDRAVAGSSISQREGSQEITTKRSNQRRNTQQFIENWRRQRGLRD